MLSLLKLPSSIGSAGKNSCDQSDQSWYLREMFPNLSESEIDAVVKRTNTVDEAEKILTMKACTKGWCGM